MCVCGALVCGGVQDNEGSLTALALAVQKPAGGGAPDMEVVAALLAAGASPDTQVCVAHRGLALLNGLMRKGLSC